MPTTTATELAQLGGLVTTDSSTSTVTVNGTLAATTITLPNNSVSTASISNSSVTAAKLANPQYTGFRNRIIGGDFGINPWQRGTTIAVAAAGNLYTADRFKSYNNTDGAYSVIKTADAPTVANAVINTEYCLDVDVTTADASLAVGQICQGVIQKIEGYNVASFGFGKAGTRYVTLSFWVKSTKTGIFYVNFTNSASNRCYPAQYTVSVTNTWENKVITVPVDTSGTWDYTNGEGLNLVWTIASNSATTGTANTWGTNVSVPNDQVNALDSTSNNFKLALIQLEAGSTATDFECRPIGTELALCQRYFQSYGGQSANDMVCMGTTNSASNFLGIVHLPVTMRTNPTVGFSAASAITIDDNGAGAVSTGITTAPYGLTSVALVVATPAVMAVNRASRAYINGSSPRLTWSAEL